MKMMEYKSEYAVKIYCTIGIFKIICLAVDEDSARDYSIGYAINLLGAEEIDRMEVTPLTETKIYTGRDCMPIRGRNYEVKRMPLAIKEVY